MESDSTESVSDATSIVAEIVTEDIVPAAILPPAISPFPISLDVIGVDNGEHGRSCVSHIVCGHFVKADNILVTKWAVQDFGDGMEQCYQVWKVAMDGLCQCHIGYLPRRVFVKKPDRYFDQVVLQVIDDLRISENRTERARSNRNYGMLFCKVVSDNPNYSGRNIFDGEAFDMSEIVVDKPIDEVFKSATPRGDDESLNSDDLNTLASSITNVVVAATEGVIADNNPKNKKRKGTKNNKQRKNTK